MVKNRSARYIFIGALVLVALFILARSSLFIVSGKTMEPEYKDGSAALIWPFSKTYQKGDAILYIIEPHYSIYFLTRVVGVPGEKIEIDGRIIDTERRYYTKADNGDQGGHYVSPHVIRGKLIPLPFLQN